MTSYVVSLSGLRSGTSTAVESPRLPPQPPSPRTKIEDRTVHSSSSPERATPSCQITDAFPLSQMSVIRVERTAAPEVGRGALTLIDWLPCTTCARLMSHPGRSSGGGSVSWNVGATIPNEGSTWRCASSRV